MHYLLRLNTATLVVIGRRGWTTGSTADYGLRVGDQVHDDLVLALSVTPWSSRSLAPSLSASICVALSLSLSLVESRNSLDTYRSPFCRYCAACNFGRGSLSLHSFEVIRSAFAAGNRRRGLWPADVYLPSIGVPPVPTRPTPNRGHRRSNRYRNV